jgi:hypothetical protein
MLQNPQRLVFLCSRGICLLDATIDTRSVHMFLLHHGVVSVFYVLHTRNRLCLLDFPRVIPMLQRMSLDWAWNGVMEYGRDMEYGMSSYSTPSVYQLTKRRRLR